MSLEGLTKKEIKRILKDRGVLIQGKLVEIVPRNERNGYSYVDFKDKDEVVLFFRRLGYHTEHSDPTKRIIFGKREITLDIVIGKGAERLGMRVEYPQCNPPIKTYYLKDVAAAYEVVNRKGN